MGLFQKIRSLCGIGLTQVEDQPIDILDKLTEKAISLDAQLQKAQEDYDRFSSDFELKIAACDKLIEKGNPESEFNKKVIVEKLEKATNDFLEQVQPITKELNEIKEKESKLSAEILAKSIEIVSLLPEAEQKQVGDAIATWQATGLIKGQEVNSQLKAIVTAIDLIIKADISDDGEAAFDFDAEIEKASDEKKKKVKKVMDEWKSGKLKSSSGEKVTDQKQALAIAMSEAGLSKAEDNEIEKGGEGSRGGKIIGHTKSGKAVYEHHSHSSYDNFTKEDHSDAADIHDKKINEYLDKIPKGTKEGAGGENEENANKHFEGRRKHLFRERQKSKIEKGIVIDSELIKAESFEGHYANVIVRNSDKILFLKRSKKAKVAPGQWCLPGGHIDERETIYQAAERELKEESNLDCKANNLYIRGKAKCEDGKWCFYLDSFGYSGDVALLDGEMENAAWMTKDEWLDADLFFDLKDHLISMDFPEFDIDKVPTLSKAEEDLPETFFFEQVLEKGGIGSGRHPDIYHIKHDKGFIRTIIHHDVKDGHFGVETSNHVKHADGTETITRKYNKNTGLHRTFFPNEKKEEFFEDLKNRGGEKISTDLKAQYESKSVEELVKLKKKLYGNVDVESPISAEEKILSEVIAKKFSDINQKIREKKLNKSEELEQLEKAWNGHRAGVEGEIREYKGKKYQKKGKIWKYMGAPHDKKLPVSEVVAHAENTSSGQLKKISILHQSQHIRDAAKRELERRKADKEKKEQPKQNNTVNKEASAVARKKKPKPVKYNPSHRLESDHHRAIEKKFGKELNKKFEYYKGKYEAMFGNVLNTDDARELSEDYRNDRAEFSPAVHEPSSALIKKLYSDMLKEPTPKGKSNSVLFTAGGTGAGKSTTMEQASSTLKKVKDKAHIVYDTNMNTFDGSVDKIDKALAVGKKVRIVYIYRHAVDAFENGAVPRAVRMGRTVPIGAHAATHAGSLKTIIELKDHYKDNKNVKIDVIDNSNGKGGSKVVDIDFLKNKTYESEQKLKEELLKLNDKLYGEGKITEKHHRGFASQAK